MQRSFTSAAVVFLNGHEERDEESTKKDQNSEEKQNKNETGPNELDGDNGGGVCGTNGEQPQIYPGLLISLSVKPQPQQLAVFFS